MTLQGAQFLPRQVGQGPNNPVGHAASADVGGAYDTDQNTGSDYQKWVGTSRLAAPQKGAMNTFERQLSYVNPTGDPGSVPLPIGPGYFGSYSFKLGQ